MKFICLECGCIFDEEDAAMWQESRGEFWGVPCSEAVSGCPICKGDYVRTYRCGCCDKWIDCDYIELASGERICENCYTPKTFGEE